MVESLGDASPSVKRSEIMEIMVVLYECVAGLA
jgi:hypothetical protein